MRGKSVVTVLPSRYLSDVASFCDVRTEHRNERKAEKDVAGRERHVLPAIVADLQE